MSAQVIEERRHLRWSVVPVKPGVQRAVSPRQQLSVRLEGLDLGLSSGGGWRRAPTTGWRAQRRESCGAKVLFL